jgi:hypothetical protein
VYTVKTLMPMSLELLKQLADEAREVEEAIRPLIPDIGEKGFVSNEIWVSANGVADDLASAYLDALSEDALESARMMMVGTGTMRAGRKTA